MKMRDPLSVTRFLQLTSNVSSLLSCLLFLLYLLLNSCLPPTLVKVIHLREIFVSRLEALILHHVFSLCLVLFLPLKLKDVWWIGRRSEIECDCHDTVYDFCPSSSSFEYFLFLMKNGYARRQIFKNPASILKPVVCFWSERGSLELLLMSWSCCEIRLNTSTSVMRERERVWGNRWEESLFWYNSYVLNERHKMKSG